MRQLRRRLAIRAALRRIRWIGAPALIGAAIGVGAFALFDAGPSASQTPAPRALAQPPRAAFANCHAARAAGAAPIARGAPGYGAHLDRDGDGVACEPYRGR